MTNILLDVDEKHKNKFSGTLVSVETIEGACKKLCTEVGTLAISLFCSLNKTLTILYANHTS